MDSFKRTRQDTELSPYFKVMYRYGDNGEYECMQTCMHDDNRLVMRREEAMQTVEHFRPRKKSNQRWRLVQLTWHQVIDLRRWEEVWFLPQ